MNQEDQFPGDGDPIGFYERRWPGCKKGDGFNFTPNALTLLMSEVNLSMGARVLLHLYNELDYDGDGYVECSDSYAGEKLSRSRRQIASYKLELRKIEFIKVVSKRIPGTLRQDVGTIDFTPTKKLVSDISGKLRAEKQKSASKSSVKNPSRCSELLDHQAGTISPLVEKCTSQKVGFKKELIKKHKGTIESGQQGIVDWLADQAKPFVRLEIRRRSSFDREFPDYSEIERQEAWEIALKRRELERTTANE